MHRERYTFGMNTTDNLFHMWTFEEKLRIKQLEIHILDLCIAQKYIVRKSCTYNMKFNRKVYENAVKSVNMKSLGTRKKFRFRLLYVLASRKFFAMILKYFCLTKQVSIIEIDRFCFYRIYCVVGSVGVMSVMLYCASTRILVLALGVLHNILKNI